MQTGVNDGLKGFIEELRTERKLRTPQNSPVEKKTTNSGGPQVGLFTGMIYCGTAQEKSYLRKGTWRPWKNEKAKFWFNECAHNHDYHWADRTFRHSWTSGSNLNPLLMKMRCRCDHHQQRPQTMSQPRPLAKEQKNAAKQSTQK